MARWSFYLLLLILLVPVISLCESAEYYIRPTALTTNTSCPGQPCLTLNHYMNNTSHYIQSNTVLNFLPGKHVLKRPLHINNIQNVTLKSSTDGSGMHSQLLVKFFCENESLNHFIYTQSAIEMINATNVAINDISLEMQTPNVSGVIVEQSTDVHLQLHIHSVQGNDSLAAGVTVNETSHLYMDGLQVGNLYNGIRIENTNKGSIINSSFDNCQNSGMVIIRSDAIDISNTTLSNNMKNGMYLESCNNTTLTSISATNNQQDGMRLISCSNVSLKDIYLENNQYGGMYFDSCRNATIMNISAITNQYGGMYFYSCENTTMMNISAINNQYDGMYFFSCENTTMMNISAINNEYDGMYFVSCENTAMMNISAINNQLSFILCKNTTMVNISAINNQLFGMYFYSCKNTGMINTSTTNNQEGGMLFYSCENTRMTNVYAINNTYEGITNSNCTNTILTDINAAYNKNSGIVIENHFQNIVLRNISVNHNGDNQITFSSSDNIQLEYSTFSDIIALPTSNIATNTVPAVTELYDCTLIMSNCTFTRNNITSIRAIGSKIIAEEQIIFSDNRALLGAALLLVSSSVLVISETSTVRFQNNHAVDYGGAIYILTDEYYSRTQSVVSSSTFTLGVTPRTRCFLSVEGNRSQTRLIFTNNTADKGGDVVYGGLVAMGYDGDWNCLLSFKNISDMSQQNGLSVISSEPSRVCLCHDGQPVDEKFVFPKEIYSYPTFINISFRSCPLGFALSRNPPFKCDCNHLLQQMPRVTCDIQHQTISRDGLVWVGTYGNNTVATSKYCQKLVWSADGNLDYLGPKHIPLFCVAVAALVFLWFPYTLLLLLGQWLHRLNYCIITCMLLNLKPFLDAHFAAFKDNHRYWFGFLLLVRAAYLLISAIIPDSTTDLVEFSTVILCILLTLWGQIVYCSRAVWTFGTAFLLNLAIMNLIMLFSGNIAITLIAIALAQFLGLILYKVVVFFKCSRRMTACCGRENEPNDDWELYEQAALEREQAALVREMESESEEDRESNESGSIESVPTYGICIYAFSSGSSVGR